MMLGVVVNHRRVGADGVSGTWSFRKQIFRQTALLEQIDANTLGTTVHKASCESRLGGFSRPQLGTTMKTKCDFYPWCAMGLEWQKGHVVWMVGDVNITWCSRKSTEARSPGV